jgi:1,2-phenylacetyl-CoA epoxidase PaaB subunit
VNGTACNLIVDTGAFLTVLDQEFARKARIDPLHHVGSVVAPNDDLARAYARATYDEERWVEMMIVPKQAIITLWSPGEEAE